MRVLAKLSLLFVVFGQLSFMAAAYYVPSLTHPSWPFWIGLYALSALLALSGAGQLKPASPDAYLAAFVIVMLISYAAVGEGGRSEFIGRVLGICIGPYFCGRIIGRTRRFSLGSGLQWLSFSYVLLVIVRSIQNPELFASDRPSLFGVPEEAEGGEPTLYYVGIALGSAWVTTFAALTLPRHLRGLQKWAVAKRSRLVMVLFPPVLLFIGSRTSMVTVVVCALFMLAAAGWISTSSKLRVAAATLALMFLVYQVLPAERKLLISGIPAALPTLADFRAPELGCSDRESLSRVVLLTEAWHLFRTAPVVGIGATNYGLRWCGPPADFGSPHSLFAHVIVEFGLVGSFLFFVFVGKVVFMFFAAMRKGDDSVQSAAWTLFPIWLFVTLSAQAIGNLYYDFEFFLLTGLLTSVAQQARVVSPAAVSEAAVAA